MSKKITTEDFVKLSEEKFGVGRFNYDKTIYKTAKTKLTITCPIHGDFKTTPDSFLHTTFGCRKCGNVQKGLSQRKSKDDFVNKANKIHQGFYDYSKFECKTTHSKGTIICPIHGEFEQEANAHLRGQGCPKCKCIKISNSKQSNQKECVDINTQHFIEKAMKIHPQINYDKTIYYNLETPSTFVCKEHGEFTQKPSCFLKAKFPCPTCRKEKTKKNKTNKFIEKARKKFGDMHDFSNMNYVNLRTAIEIKCKKHEISYMIPIQSYLRSDVGGCPECKRENIQKIQLQKAKKDFFKKIKIKFPNLDATNVEYVDSTTAISLTCPKHGDFEKTPRYLLSPMNVYGCPECCKEQRAKNNKISKEEAISYARKVHGTKYDYSLLPDFMNEKYSRTKVKIICPIHGTFEQMWRTHLEGHGCKKCADDIMRPTLEEFINRANDIHGIGTYDYSLIDQYKNKRVKLPIICANHGTFYMSAEDHVKKGFGCPQCGRDRIKSHGEERIEKILKVKNVCFEVEKKIDCLGKANKSKFDFYIKGVGFIEFDGNQHFKPYEFYGGEKRYKQLKSNDQKKNQYCEQNQIPLLRIKYNQFDKIKEMIEDFILNKENYLKNHNTYLTNTEYYRDNDSP